MPPDAQALWRKTGWDKVSFGRAEESDNSVGTIKLLTFNSGKVKGARHADTPLVLARTVRGGRQEGAYQTPRANKCGDGFMSYAP